MSLPPPVDPGPADNKPSLDALAATADTFTQIMELVSGHRNQAIAAGFPEHFANIMAINLHMQIVSNINPTGTP